MHRRRTLSIVAALLATALLAACGGGDDGGVPIPDEVPEGAVVAAGDGRVERDRFERFLTARVRGVSPLAPRAAAAPTPLDPPAFRRCAEQLRRDAARGARELPEGQRPARPSDEELVAGCRAQYEQAREATLTTLTQGLWVEQEAATAGVEVSEDEVAAARRQYEAAAGLGDDGAAASPGEARRRYAELLERSGLQAGDVDWQLRTQLLQQRLVERAAREVEEPTDEEVRRFFRERPELFGGTASREVVLAVADDRDQARREERRLRAGEEGPATTVVRGAGFLPPAVERAVFAARRGEVVGPVEAGGRLYVARVVRVTEEGERPRFEDAAPEARQRLQAERTQRVQVEFQNGLQERWRPATLCADDLRVPQCRNGPEAAPLPVPGDEER